MTTFFLIGTFWFWSLVIITFVLLSIFVNKEKSSGTLATTIFLLSLGAFFYMGNQELFFEFIDFVKNSPFAFLGYVVGYVFIGAIWSVVKWYFFLVEVKNYYLERKQRHSDASLVIPLAKNYKSTIIMWMSYWIVSIYWTFLKEFVTGIWNKVYIHLGGLYDKMSNRIFKDVVELKAKEDEAKKAKEDEAFKAKLKERDKQ
jgi:hypothetical protein